MSVTQDLTIFSDNDTTPILGAVDEGGGVTEASFSTDPAHPRPFLKTILQQGASGVDLLRGEATIGQINAEVVDHRTDPDDQASGIVTSILADAGGETNLIGRRVVIRQQHLSGPWRILLDGPLSGVRLDPATLVTYKLITRDTNERVRRTRLFTRAETTSLIPAGVVGGYGFLFDLSHLPFVSGPTYMIGPVGHRTGVYRADSDANGEIHDPGVDADGIPESTYAASRPAPAYDDAGSYDGMKWSRIAVMWKPKDADESEWRTLRDMRFVPLSFFDATDEALLKRPGDDGGRFLAVRLWTAAGDGSDLPADGQEVDYRVLYAGEPTEARPLYLEGAAHEILRDLYDGVYSEYPPGVKYDAAALAALPALRTPMRAVIREPVDDALAWATEHIYAPLGAAPALNARMEVAPIAYALPDPSVPLIQLDDSNAKEDAAWSHTDEDAVAAVDFTYIREHVVTDEDGRIVRIDEQEMHVRRIHAASSRVDGEEIAYAPATVRAVGSLGGGEAAAPDYAHELGQQLASERADQAFDRFRLGGQRVVARCRRGDAGVDGARVGDWATCGMSWLPDYLSGTRGMNRLMQLVAIEELDPRWRRFELVDAGPDHQPIGQPTLGTMTANTDGTIRVPVTAVPPGGAARLSYAVAEIEPDVGDERWSYLARTDEPREVVSPPFPSEATVWVRGRGEAPGRRPSAWLAPVSVDIPAGPRVSAVRITFDADGTPTAHWAPNPSCGGVRIHHRPHDPGETVDPVTDGSSVDADAAALAHALAGVVVGHTRALTIEAEPWTGWDASTGVVTGTAGGAVRRTRANGVLLPNAPGTDARIVLSEVRDRATVHVGIESPIGEGAALAVRLDDGPVWDLVMDTGSAALRYAPAGSEVDGSTAWFKRRGEDEWEQVLAEITLHRDQLRTLRMQPVGRSGAVGPWEAIPVSALEQPWLESVAVAWDESAGRLRGRVVPGGFCRSGEALFLARDGSASHGVPDVAMDDGDALDVVSPALGAAERGKEWRLRVRPFNGPLDAGDASGLPGAAQEASVHVPAGPGGGIEPPRVGVIFIARDPNNEHLRFEWEDGQGGSGPYAYRWRVSVGGETGDWQPGSGDGWQGTAAQSVERFVSRPTHGPGMLNVEVRYQAHPSLVGIGATVVSPRDDVPPEDPGDNQFGGTPGPGNRIRLT